VNPIYQGSTFILKKQIFALTGVLRLYDESGQAVAYSRQKMFRLREDIRVFSDETQSQELLSIKARQILDFSAAYDVYDSMEGRMVGTLRRRGFHSMVRDTWEVLAPGDQVVGTLTEDSLNYALLRRFLLGRLLPQDYDLTIADQKVMDLRQRFHFFRYELELDFRMDTARRLDRRLGIAAGILLGIIEGKQESG
jgi:uncharacterized protein YxjI